MKRTSKNVAPEAELGWQSQKLAEDESKLVARHLLDEAITEFLEWRAFSYWLRLCVETDGSVSESLAAMLRERFPGFWNTLRITRECIQVNRSFFGFGF